MKHAMTTRAFGLALWVWSTAFARSDFRGIGLLPDAPYYNSVTAMSDDGRTVVIGGRQTPQGGYSRSWIWTWPDGLAPLDLGADGTSSVATGISNSGEHVTGTVTLSSGVQNVVRWESGGTLVRTYGTTGSVANDFPFLPRVSGNGNVITCGRFSGGNRDAHRWTTSQGFMPIRSSNGNNINTLGISQEGGLIFGAETSPIGGEHPWNAGWVWTTQYGLRNLQGMAVRSPQVIVPGTSSLVGSTWSDWIDSNPFALVRWEPNGSMQFLTEPVYNTGLAFSAVGVNTSCDLLAGNGRLGFSDTTSAMVWRASGGFALLTDFFTAAGVDFSGWTLTSVSKMSADGLTFAGVGINPDGFTETWIATIPSPGVVLVLGAGLAMRSRR